MVGVTAEFIEFDDFGAQAHRFTKDVDFGLLVDDLAAEGMFSLEAGDQDGVAGVFDVVLEVVEDAAKLAHARGGDDDARRPEIVERLGFGNVLDIAELAESEGLLPVRGETGGFFVVEFGAIPEDFGDSDGQRTIDEDGDAGDTPLLDESMQDED